MCHLDRVTGDQTTKGERREESKFVGEKQR